MFYTKIHKFIFIYIFYASSFYVQGTHDMPNRIMNFFCKLKFYCFWNHKSVIISCLWKKKLLSRTWHAGLLTFQVNENGCYRKVIVFVLFLCIFFFYISWATKVLQKWKTVSLLKVISKTKITWSKRCWLK